MHLLVEFIREHLRDFVTALLLIGGPIVLATLAFYFGKWDHDHDGLAGTGQPGDRK